MVRQTGDFALLYALIDPPVLDSPESIFRLDLSLPPGGRPSHPIYQTMVTLSCADAPVEEKILLSLPGVVSAT